MSEIESRVDAKLADLARRELALTDAEANAPPGAPKPLDEMILSLCSLASNPSGVTPKLPGVDRVVANRNHVTARLPIMTLALTAGTVYGSEIETKERGDVQPDGRTAARVLAQFRQTTVPYGSQRFPIMDTGATAGMVADGGAAVSIVDGTFRNPAPEARPHQAQARAQFSLQNLIQGPDVFRGMVDDSLRVALSELMLSQVLAGSGVVPNVLGIRNLTGIETSDYTSTNRGSAASFRDAEDLLEGAQVGPEIRPSWIVASSLWRAARKNTQGTRKSGIRRC